jgi:hypothetical protein
MIDLSCIAWAVHEAVEHDLPPVVLPARTRTRPDGSTFTWPEVTGLRPHDNRIEVHSWPQTWSNTSLGMGGMAGQALTTAQTTVVLDMTRGIGACYVQRTFRGLFDVNEDTLDRIARNAIITGRYPHGHLQGHVDE